MVNKRSEKLLQVKREEEGGSEDVGERLYREAAERAEKAHMKAYENISDQVNREYPFAPNLSKLSGVSGNREQDKVDFYER